MNDYKEWKKGKAKPKNWGLRIALGCAALPVVLAALAFVAYWGYWILIAPGQLDRCQAECGGDHEFCEQVCKEYRPPAW